MNPSDLARLMLEWEEHRKRLDFLEFQIGEAVLGLGKSQTVGNVRATYSAGRKKYEYARAADGHPMVSRATIDLFTTPKTDWRALCRHVGIEDIPFTQSAPSVSIKLLT